MLTAALLALGLQADSLTRDLGTIIAEEGVATTTFVLTNTSEDTLAISHTRTSCSCTRAYFTQRSIVPGDTAHVTVTFNPNNRIGPIDEQILVYCPEEPLRLHLTGRVKSKDLFPHLRDSLGRSLKIKYKTINVGDLQNGQTRRISVPCGNISGRPVKVSAIMLPNFLKLSSTPSPIPPGAEADIVFTLDGTLCPKGKNRATVMVMGLDGRPSDCIITLNVTKQ